MNENSIEQAYLESAVNTASAEHLLIMLYDGLNRFIRRAIRSIEVKDYEEASQNIKYAEDIALHLRACLTDEHTPEISKNLTDLYSYWYLQLVKANQLKSVDLLRAIIPDIQTIRDSFSQVEKSMILEGKD